MTALKMQTETMRYYGFGYEAMKQIKVCEKCGTAAGTHQLFCKGCGAFLTRKNLYDKYKKRQDTCKKCKIILPHGARFCPQCGEETY